MFKKIAILLFVVLLLVFFVLPPLLIAKEFVSYLFYFFFVDPLFILLFYLLYLKNRTVLDDLRLKQERLHEIRNIGEKDISELIGLESSLKDKIQNYQRLKDFTGDLNNEMSLDEICDIIIEEMFALFSSKGNALLYLLNERTRALELRANRRMDSYSKIKEKKGDLFDQWALRHSQPLLVEDTSSDFRFNPERVREEISRPLGSVICAPLITEANVLGILRIDSPVVRSFDSEDLRFLSVIGDISKLALENAIYFSRMQKLSITDGLTGSSLRRYGMERLKEEFMRALREGSPLSFWMLDIDHFKDFNDRFGHMGGDVVLKKLARWLKDFLSMPGVVVVRYGGEEFCAILPHVRKKEAVRLAEEFRLSLSEREINLRRQKVRITVSIGVSNFPEGVKIKEDLVRCADDALLSAKRRGRNRVCCS